MIRMILASSSLLLAMACGDGAAPSSSTTSTAAVRTTSPTTSPAPRGEAAPYEIEGDVVKVNNRICAVSRTPMAEDSLGQYVSRVRYDGPDPRFAGKTLEFNQCCPMCLDRFPELWAQHRDEILRYHGLLAES